MDLVDPLILERPECKNITKKSASSSSTILHAKKKKTSIGTVLEASGIINDQESEAVVVQYFVVKPGKIKIKSSLYSRYYAEACGRVTGPISAV